MLLHKERFLFPLVHLILLLGVFLVVHSLLFPRRLVLVLGRRPVPSVEVVVYDRLVFGLGTVQTDDSLLNRKLSTFGLNFSQLLTWI